MPKRASIWAWFWVVAVALYFLVPLYATFRFSLQYKRDELSFTAYANVLQSPDFIKSFTFSLETSIITILVSTLLIVPTAYWVQLKLPRARSLIEFITLLPFVIPAVVLVFGLIRAYNGTGLTDSSNGVYTIMVGAYVTLSFPYVYRSVDNGLQSIKVRTLTEAAQSLGAGWITILFRVIFPNVFVSILNGAFITFAIVMGEFTIASLLSQKTFGPYLFQLSSAKTYEPSALTILSLGLTWLCIALIQLLGRRSGQARTTMFR
jgi:putative spermidine/putrescine transport system permease protein